MQVWAFDAPGSPDAPNELAGFHPLPGLYQDFRLVHIGGINTPTMVNDRGIPAHRQRPGKYDDTGRGSVNIGAFPADNI
jgi:hypothetical protein